MIVVIVLYFVGLVYVSVRLSRTAVRAWKGGDRRRGILYAVAACYFWFRAFALGMMLWDIIGGFLALRFVRKERFLR